MKRLGKYEGLTYLTLLVIILPLVVWRLSLARTVERWGDIRRGKREIAAFAADSTGARPAAAALDTVELIAGGALLERIGRDAAGSGVAVVRYTPYLTRSGEGFALRTAEVVLAGSFAPLVRVIDRIERELPSCKIASATFRTVKKRQQPHLQLTLLVRQLTETH